MWCLSMVSNSSSTFAFWKNSLCFISGESQYTFASKQYDNIPCTSAIELDYGVFILTMEKAL